MGIRKSDGERALSLLLGMSREQQEDRGEAGELPETGRAFGGLLCRGL